MRKLFVVIASFLALTASTCSVPKPVVVPKPPTLPIDVNVQCQGKAAPSGVLVKVNTSPGGFATATINDRGYAHFDIPSLGPTYLQIAAVPGCNSTDYYPIDLGHMPHGGTQGIWVNLTTSTQPVHLDGVHLRTADGAIYRYRSVTAMDLMAPTSDGLAFLDWAQATGFHDVRVLTTASITAPLSPAAGEAGIAALCQQLRTRNMGAELVLNADTGAQNMVGGDISQHVRNITLAVQTNCGDIPIIMEIANENANTGSGGQNPILQDDSFLISLKGIIHGTLPTMPVSLGSTCCNQPDSVPPYSGGDYVTLHLDRSRLPFWDEVRRVKDLIDLQNQSKTLVADDEGMGAGEADEPGRRSANPTRFFVQGVLDRLGELGSTFHCNDCVSAKVPGPVQQACAKAFIAGATIVPDDQIFQFYNDTIGDAATDGGDWNHVEKLFTFENVTGGKSYVVALNVTGDPGIKWRNGWHQTGQVNTPYQGIQILEISK